MIGERLAEVRKDHGDTQAALAKRLRVTLSAVRSWEQEKSSPPTKCWWRYAGFIIFLPIICWGFPM